MDKEMELSLQQMMAHLLAEIQAGQAEMKASQEEIKARQDKTDAEAKAHHDQLKDDIKGHMEDLLEGLRSCVKWMTVCQVPSEACPEKLKAGPEETEADVITFEETSDKIKSKDVEATLKATRSAVERQELHECLVVQRRQWVKKWTQDSIWSWQKLSATQKRLIRSTIPAV
jgi:hypothetical protein